MHYKSLKLFTFFWDTLYYIHDKFHFHCSLHLRDTGGHFDPSPSLTLQQPSWGKVADYRRKEFEKSDKMETTG